jgi:hypothetical protein
MTKRSSSCTRSTIERTLTVTFVLAPPIGTKNTTPTRKWSDAACQAIRRSGTRIMIWTSLWTSSPLMDDVHEKWVLSILSIFLMELMNAGKSSNRKQRW